MAARKKTKSQYKKVGTCYKRKVSAKTKKAGKEVISYAKKIRKANPKKKWSTCMKEGGAKYRRAH